MQYWRVYPTIFYYPSIRSLYSFNTYTRTICYVLKGSTILEGTFSNIALSSSSATLECDIGGYCTIRRFRVQFRAKILILQIRFKLLHSNFNAWHCKSDKIPISDRYMLVNEINRRELIPFGVTVHIIKPAFFKTAMTSEEILIEPMKKRWDKLPETLKNEYGGQDYLNKRK